MQRCNDATMQRCNLLSFMRPFETCPSVDSIQEIHEDASLGSRVPRVPFTIVIVIVIVIVINILTAVILVMGIDIGIVILVIDVVFVIVIVIVIVFVIVIVVRPFAVVVSNLC